MSSSRRSAWYKFAVCCAIIVGLLAGCTKTDDSITKAEKTEKDRPGIAETKAIA